MTEAPARITLQQWDRRYHQLSLAGLCEPAYGGPLRRHVDDGDRRLLSLSMDNSPAALRLWNFLLTEEDRLHDARRQGKRIVGAMKDLGTVPVLAFSLADTVAFYPDGAWWIPCVMHGTTRLLEIADRLGIDDSFCPVRAVLGAFVNREHFPIPDLLTCSVGATCDDFSAIAQRLEALGHPIPEHLAPLEALARLVLADPMVGSAIDRAEGICRDVAEFGAEAVVISRIPGASHCALEGAVIQQAVRSRLGLPVVELEVPSICDAGEPTLRTRLESLVETVMGNR